MMKHRKSHNKAVCGTLRNAAKCLWHVYEPKGQGFESLAARHEKGLYQNDYSDRVDNSSDFMSQNAKKRKKTPPKGAKSKGYTALAKTTFSLEWL